MPVFLAVAFLVGVGASRTHGPSPAAAAPAAPSAPSVPSKSSTTSTTAPPPLPGSALADPATVSPTTWVDRGDPVMVSTGDQNYFYWTQPLPNLNVPFQSQTAGGPWGPMDDALPTLPAWAAPGATWAPEVHRFGDRWVLYFAAGLASEPTIHCIGDAVSTTPAGPFLAGGQPLVCQTALGGSIDPRVFADPGGSAYLFWKSDQNVPPGYGPTELWSQPLSATGLALTGQAVAVYTAHLAWQGGLVEAPDMVVGGGAYWLFYSGGVGYFSPDYAIGVARCAGPAGPCTDPSTSPFLDGNQQGQGPGEESVYVAPSGDWLVYNPTCSTVNKIPRPTAIVRLGFGPFGPYLAQA